MSELLVARQIILRQRWPLIRDFGFFADHRNRPSKAALAQRNRGLRAAVARADD